MTSNLESDSKQDMECNRTHSWELLMELVLTVLTHTSESLELTTLWFLHKNRLLDSTKGGLRFPFFYVINNTMEDNTQDGRWNWWGLLEEEDEEKDGDTDNK
jgi:hypothetical protein